MIPRYLYQTWKTHEVPSSCREYQQHWLEHHRGWTYSLRDDQENRLFIKRHCPHRLPMYDQLKASAHPICAVDYWRYALMAYGETGGWYLDLDTDCYRSLEALEAIPGAKIVLGSPFNHYRFLECAIMGSVPNHPFWFEVLNDIDRSLRQRRYRWLRWFNDAAYVLTLTGPICLGRVYAQSKYQSDIAMVARDTLYSESWFAATHSVPNAGRVATHKQHNTWIDPASTSARFGAICRSLNSTYILFIGLIVGFVVVLRKRKRQPIKE